MYSDGAVLRQSVRLGRMLGDARHTLHRRGEAAEAQSEVRWRMNRQQSYTYAAAFEQVPMQLRNFVRGHVASRLSVSMTVGL